MQPSRAFSPLDLPADSPCRCNNSSCPESPQLTPHALSVKFSFSRNRCNLQASPSRPPWTQLSAKHPLNYPPESYMGADERGLLSRAIAAPGMWVCSCCL